MGKKRRVPQFFLGDYFVDKRQRQGLLRGNKSPGKAPFFGFLFTDILSSPDPLF